MVVLWIREFGDTRLRSTIQYDPQSRSFIDGAGHESQPTSRNLNSCMCCYQPAVHLRPGLLTAEIRYMPGGQRELTECGRGQ